MLFRSLLRTTLVLGDRAPLRVQLQEALSVFGEPEAGEQAPEPETTAEQEDTFEERSWYGLPDADAA